MKHVSTRADAIARPLESVKPRAYLLSKSWPFRVCLREMGHPYLGNFF